MKTGYFEFSVLWCLVIGAALNSTGKVLLQRRVRKAVLRERAASNTRTHMFSDLETCNWLNQILSGVYGNHHKYISLLFVRFANGLLQELCTPAPIESVSFAQLDVGIPGPKLSNIVVKLDDLKAKSLNFDFTVDYVTDFNGVVLSKLARTPEMFVNISNLTFNCRMRFKVEFLSDKFPFLKSLGWSFLSKPAINISVRASALPGYLEMPSITEHFLESVRERMYFKIGTPKLVEGDFTRFSDNGDVAHQAERFLQALPFLVQEMIKHGELVISEQEQQNVVLKRGKKYKKDRDLTSMSVPPRANSPLIDPGRPPIPKVDRTERVERLDRVEKLEREAESIPSLSVPNESTSLSESADSNPSTGRSRRSRSFNTDQQKITSPDLSPHKRRHSIDSSDEGIKLMSLTNPLSDSEEQTFDLVSPRRRANTDQLVPSPVMVPKHQLNKSSSASVETFPSPSEKQSQSPLTSSGKDKDRKKVRHLASKLKRVFKNE